MNDFTEALLRITRSAGFQAIGRKAQEQYRREHGGTGGTTADRAMAEAVIEDIKNEIAEAVFAKSSTVYDNAGHSPEGLFDVVFSGIDKNGDYAFELNFKPYVVHRRSLWPEGYPEGLSNIIALYSHGSKPSKGPIWNTGTKIPWGYSGVPRPIKKGIHKTKVVYEEGSKIFIPRGSFVPPDPFLVECIANINARYASNNIKLTLNRKYMPMSSLWSL